MANILNKLFNVDKKRMNELEKLAKPIEKYAEVMSQLSDDELREKTTEFKNRLANNETLDDLLPEAFATVREAAKRVINEYPYFVQLLGGVALHGGDIAEMKTGEGKTLTSVLPVYLNALSGKGVHVITVNEYLAERDSKWMGKIHKFLGLTVGLNLRQLSPAQKREAYNCDITYTTNAEAGFDYLRDNMVTRIEDRVLRELNFALVDEVDSILIDESRTPLIISGGQKQTANLYIQADRFVKSLKNDEDYTIDVKGKSVHLTEDGVFKAEKSFKIKNLYELDHTQLVHHITQALKANFIMQKDTEYVVDDNQIVIVDQFTGRLMKGRAYSDGLHHAIEAKEGVQIKQETSTLATITYQNFFRLYNKLAGMTGTAKTEEEEFVSIYNMRVMEIPTNRPIARMDYPDAIYGSKKAKYEALIEEVIECHEKGQPVLVGTIAVETSELISDMLKKRKIRHEVLNAKNHSREAEIIKNAGRVKAVTIATNMAGRGTDIKLQEGVRELGGLAVLGSERHESRRIDNQLRGRAGRQGDPGYSRFYVSVKDELMVRFGSERMEGIFSQMGDRPLESRVVSKSIGSAQKRVEGHNFDIRKTLLQYDDVLRQQREIIYEQRNYVLENDDVHSIVKDMFNRVVSKTVMNYVDNSNKEASLDVDGCLEALTKIGFAGIVKKEDLIQKSVAEVDEICTEAAWQAYSNKIEQFKSQILAFEKTIVLKTMDRIWINHIDTMDKLRTGIHLRSYAQGNPLQAYISEGFELFEDMMARISQDIVLLCLNLKIVVKEKK